jgi:glutathione S-transferase
MRMVDDALARVGGSGPYFLGGAGPSMVDLMFVPFMERQAASLLYWKGFKIRNGDYDNIDRCAHGPSRLS